MALTIDELQVEIKARSESAASGIDALTASLNKLRTVVKGGIGLTTATKQLQAFSQAVNSMQVPTQKIADLVSALKPLETIGKSNLGSALNQLKKIPEITAGLDDAKLSAFADKIRQVTDAVRPLATEMEKVSSGFSKLPARIQKVINANAHLSSSNKKLGLSYKTINLAAFVTAIRNVYNFTVRVGRVIAGWIKESNDYVENLNLFTVAMGEYAESAQAYAEQVGELFGIDPSEWMRNQGVFMTLATGFGVASDKAALMSKNLTQLGYDLSSFYNISVEDAMQKLQAGIAGELEPLRRLGYDLSQAKLEAIAMSLGINKAVSEMTQAEKSQLRYYAILTQVTQAQGDMARTLEAPANQLRILKAQATQAARALGNIFIPALNAVLPYAIAFLKIIRMTANEIANFFGFELPEIDYSGLANTSKEAQETTDAFNDANEAAKALQKTLFGFDKLNVLNSNKLNNALEDLTGDSLNFKLPEYDFLSDLVSNRVDEAVKKLKEHLEPLQPFFEGMWKIIESFSRTLKDFYDDKLYPWLVDVGQWMKDNPETLEKLGKGLAIVAIALTLFKGVKWLGEITGITKLISWLGKLIFKTDGVTSAFKNKNKALEKQTEQTAAETEAVNALVPSMAAAAIAAASFGKALGDIKLPEWGEDPIAAPAFAPVIAPEINLSELFEPSKELYQTSIDAPVVEQAIVPKINTEKFAPSLDKAQDMLTQFEFEAKLGLDKWGEAITASFNKTIDALSVATKRLNTPATNFQRFVNNTSENVAKWGNNVAGNYRETMNYIPKATADTLTPAGKAYNKFLEVTSKNMAKWGTNTSKNMGQTAKMWYESFVYVLSDMWDQFVGFMKGTGNKISEWWSANKKWAAPAALTLGGVVLGAVTLGLAIVPALPALGAVLASIPTFAQGGFPKTGQLFIAREAGPEMVGTIGGRTAVGTNKDIVDGIRQGVYEAVTAAMNGNESAPYIVMIDDQPIFEGIAKRNREMIKRTGRSVLGVT